MSKKTKGMLALLLAFGVLLGVYVLIKPAEETEKEPEEETVTYTVLTVDNTTVSELEYRIAEGGETYLLSLKSDATGWTWQDDPELPLSNTSITSMVSAVMSLTSSYCVEDVSAEALSDTYGITEESIYVRAKDGNGNVTLRFGKVNSYNSMQYVARSDEPTKVYMISSTVKNSLKAPASILEQEKLPEVAEAKLRAVRLVRDGVDYLYNRETVTGTDEEGGTTTEYVWTLIKDGGEATPVDSADGEQIQNAVLSLSYGTALTFHSAEWDAYGVGETPVSRLTVYYTYTTSLTDSTTEQTFNTEVQTSYELYLGNETETGSFYARLPEGNGVYEVVLNIPTD